VGIEFSDNRWFSVFLKIPASRTCWFVPVFSEQTHQNQRTPGSSYFENLKRSGMVVVVIG
jgi:hypothetical protein